MEAKSAMRFEGVNFFWGGVRIEGIIGGGKVV